MEDLIKGNEALVVLDAVWIYEVEAGVSLSFLSHKVDVGLVWVVVQLLKTLLTELALRQI